MFPHSQACSGVMAFTPARPRGAAPHRGTGPPPNERQRSRRRTSVAAPRLLPCELEVQQDRAVLLHRLDRGFGVLIQYVPRAFGDDLQFAAKDVAFALGNPPSGTSIFAPASRS